ncbi:MAG TPA: ABC transporter substrate-binding protein [Xanthobacteraceae bacterium]|nr:ABC transporter substrate-binding protein [Xanthobacteraceae bacterium]
MGVISSDIVKSLAPSGTLRVALNLGNMVLVQGTAEAPRGVTVDLARELAGRLGVPVEFNPFPGAGEAFRGFQEKKLDIVFLAIEPARAAQIDFTAPYVIIEGVYMVRQNSPLKSVGEVDREGIRIGVIENSAYDLYLTRTLRHAKLVRGADGVGLFVEQGLDAAGGVKQPLAAYATANPQVRLLPGRFMEIQQAMGTQKERGAGAEYLRAFIEEMKASGFVADALTRSNQPDAAVAPLTR